MVAEPQCSFLAMLMREAREAGEVYVKRKSVDPSTPVPVLPNRLVMNVDPGGGTTDISLNELTFLNGDPLISDNSIACTSRPADENDFKTLKKAGISIPTKPRSATYQIKGHAVTG